MKIEPFSVAAKQFRDFGRHQVSARVLVLAVPDDESATKRAASLVVEDFQPWRVLRIVRRASPFPARHCEVWGRFAGGIGLPADPLKVETVSFVAEEVGLASDFVRNCCRTGLDWTILFDRRASRVEITHHNEVEFFGRLPARVRAAVIASGLRVVVP